MGLGVLDVLFDSLIYFRTAELFIPLAVVIFIAC